MSGLMKRYEESRKRVGSPVMYSEIKEFVDYRALCSYADEKGVSPSDLSKEEQKMFVKKRR